jgi:hypothetical protein
MRRVTVLLAVVATFLFSCGENPASGGGATPANAIRITLTYWETHETDLLDSKLDPRIYFRIISRQNGATIRTSETGYLLNRDNVGQRWSGNSVSSPITFAESADEIRVYAVVMESDPAVSDDISPGYSKALYAPFHKGVSGSASLGYGSGKSSVDFSYEFLTQ